ncbi:unnamed protein product [Amoebophrya sp. A120]|nr:unnamed protein product [Amoebophrya sp. A120]|eukprot:GSA120T00015243001.1
MWSVVTGAAPAGPSGLGTSRPSRERPRPGVANDVASSVGGRAMSDAEHFLSVTSGTKNTALAFTKSPRGTNFRSVFGRRLVVVEQEHDGMQLRRRAGANGASIPVPLAFVSSAHGADRRNQEARGRSKQEASGIESDIRSRTGTGRSLRRNPSSDRARVETKKTTPAWANNINFCAVMKRRLNSFWSRALVRQQAARRSKRRRRQTPVSRIHILFGLATVFLIFVSDIFWYFPPERGPDPDPDVRAGLLWVERIGQNSHRDGPCSVSEEPRTSGLEIEAHLRSSTGEQSGCRRKLDYVSESSSPSPTTLSSRRHSTSSWFYSPVFVAAQYHVYDLHCKEEVGVNYDDNFRHFADGVTALSKTSDENWATLNMQVDSSSFTTGCHGSVTNQWECCALCGQYWPHCVSWVWVKQSIGSNFPEENVCCLKSQFRPNPRTTDADTGQVFFFLISGFFNQRCAITGDCKIRTYTRNAVSSHSYSSDDKYLVVNYADECGSPNVTYAGPYGGNDILGNPISATSNIVPGVTVPSWGATMPNYGTNATAGTGSYSYTYTGAGIVIYTLEEQEVNMGTLSVGEVDEYKVCYSTNGGATFQDYDKTVGTLTMSGPNPDAEHFICTLGVECYIYVTGFQQDVNMKLAKPTTDTAAPTTQDPQPRAYIITVSPDTTCGAAVPTLVNWGNGFNPRIQEDSAVLVQNVYADWRLSQRVGVFRGFLSGPTGVNYTICYAADPEQMGGINAYSNYILPLGSFFVNGPNQNPPYRCTLSLPCRIDVDGAGLLPSNGILLHRSDSANPCGDTLSAKALLGDQAINPLPANWVNDTFTYFEFGVPTQAHSSDEPGENYKLCWGGFPPETPPTCSVANCLQHYNILLGLLIIIGPQRENNICYMTFMCQIDLRGHLIPPESNIAVIGPSETCSQESAGIDITGGIGSALPWRNPGYGIQNYVDGSTEVYRLGMPSFGTVKADYQLCYSAVNETNTTFFRMRLGRMEIRGPVVHSYGAFFCTMGENCQIQFSTDSVGLQDSNYALMLAVNQSCGFSTTQAPLQAVIANEWTNPRQTQGTSPARYSFGTVRSGSPATHYPICWSHEPTNDGANLLEFRFEVGFLRMKGPFPQTTPCTLGLSCQISLTGVDLTDDNVILIIQSSSTCGDVVPAMPSYSNMDEIKKTTAGSTGATYDTGTPKTGPPGTFKLCWSCGLINGNLGAIPQNFRQYYKVTIGDFVMSGPNNPVASACELSMDCTITLYGNGLASTNSILIINYRDASNQDVACGDAGATPVDFEGVTLPTFVQQDGSYNTYKVGPITTGIAGQFYRVCWSHAATVNTTNRTLAKVEEYNVQVGMFTLVGANYETLVTCTLGEVCQVAITGVGLAATQEAAIIEYGTECGATNAQLAVFTNFPNPVQTDQDGNFNKFSFQTPLLGTPGMYRLCFAFDPPVSTDPLYLQGFKFEIGPFKMVGPVQVPKFCYLSMPCDIPLTGTDLASTNALLIIDRGSNCGDTTPTLHYLTGQTNPKATALSGAANAADTYLTGSPFAGRPGINGKVCWAHNPSSLTTYQDYKVTIGFFTVYGPKQRLFKCFDGTYNVAQILGIYQVLCTLETNEAITAQQDANDGNTYKVLSGPYQGWYLYETSLTNHKGTLFTENPARVPNAFTNSWYEVRGPTVACTLGQACTILLEGFGLANTNQVYIITSSQPCGNAAATPGAMVGLTNPRLVSDDDYDNQYRMGIVTVGGSYVACRVDDPSNTCIGDHYKLCWSHSPQTGVTSYITQVGIFEMKGPFVDFSADCTIGRFCTVNVYGTGFANSNRLLLIKGTSTCGDDDMEVAEFQGFVNPQQAEATVDGKEEKYIFGISTSGDEDDYKMCWGFSPLELQQHNIEVGPFSFKAPPPGCFVQNKWDIVCYRDLERGYPGNEFKDVVTYYEDWKGQPGSTAYVGANGAWKPGTRPI